MRQNYSFIYSSKILFQCIFVLYIIFYRMDCLYEMMRWIYKFSVMCHIGFKSLQWTTYKYYVVYVHGYILARISTMQRDFTDRTGTPEKNYIVWIPYMVESWNTKLQYLYHSSIHIACSKFWFNNLETWHMKNFED